MKKLKVTHQEILGKNFVVTLINEYGTIYHYSIPLEDLEPCDEGCNDHLNKKYGAKQKEGKIIK